MKGISFKKVYTPIANIKRISADEDNPKYEDPRELRTAYMDERQYSGASAVPEHSLAPSEKCGLAISNLKDHRIFG